MDETSGTFTPPVTRERIRQIEAEAWAYYTPIIPEITAARRTILRCLINRGGFVSLASLGADEPHLASFVTHPTAFKASVKALNLGDAYIADSDLGPVLLRMSCSDVSKLMSEMRRVRWTLPAAETPSVFAERFLEFIQPSLLTVQALENIVVHCLDLKDPCTDKVETSLKSVLDPAVKAMLEQSPEPLHWNDIAARVRAGLPKNLEFDDLALTTTLREPWALMLGQGTYGVEKHLNLSDFAKRTISHEVHTVMSVEGAAGRQWSCVDLLEKLPEDLKTLFSLDKFRLACVLRMDSNTFVDVGRGIFVLNTGKPVERLTFGSLIEASLLSIARQGTADFLQLATAIAPVRSCAHSALRMALRKHPLVREVQGNTIFLAIGD